MNNSNNNPTPDSKLPLGMSHLSPAPIFTTVKAKIERGDAYSAPEIFDVEITVLEALRGNEALTLIDVSSNLIKEGFEFLVVRIRFGYFRRGRGFGDKPLQIMNDQFSAVSNDGQIQYPVISLEKQPSPALIGESFKPGESKEGYIVLQVQEDEKEPLLIYNREFIEGVYGIWGSIYFQLY